MELLKGTSEPCGEEVFDWVISSDLLLLRDPDTPIHLHDSSGSHSFPDTYFAPSTLALSCSCEVVQYFGSDHFPIPQTVPLPPLFHSKMVPFLRFSESSLGRLCFSLLTFTVVLHKNTLLSPLVLLSSLALNAAKFSIPFGRIKLQLQAWWSPKVEDALSVRCKAFAAALRSDKDRWACISAY